MKKMGRHLAVIILILAFALSPLSFSGILSLPQAVASEEISGYQEWTQSKDVYGHIYIMPGATLVIKKGVTLNFKNNYAKVYVYGNLDVQGGAAEPVIFNSSLLNGRGFSIETKTGSNVKIRNARLVNGGSSLYYVQNGMLNKAMAAGYTYRGAIQIYGGTVDVDYTFFEKNYDAVVIDRLANATVRVNQSAFINNRYDVEDQKGGSDFQYNWWGYPDGPKKICYIYTGKEYCYYEKINNKVSFSNWLSEIPQMQDEGCQENCFSSVMFLPGIKASKLYKEGSAGTEDQLWLPNYFGDDLADLALDEDGNSINDVYTKDVLAEVPNGNIYKSFLNELAELKNAGTIADYEAFAYDWRASAEEVAQNGTPYAGGITKSAIVDLQALAEKSKSKKVTLVAHSNGGLVAKAMMLELERTGAVDLVDKIIFVGTPQMGTPLSVLSMLYGYEESSPLGWLISRSEARLLAENMPGAYGLLPSEEYFEWTENPFITFSSQNTRYKDFFTAYGENIDSFVEFKQFLLGTDDNRTKPEASEVEKENVLNEKLLTQAQEIHQRLDAWVPPASVEVIQLAGWGLDTVSGVEYAEKEKTKCVALIGKIPTCINTGEYEAIYDPQFSVDGDKVVVAPSALMFSGSESIKKYWFDLYGYNKEPIINRKYNHTNLFEVSFIRQLIFDKIKNIENATLPEFMQASRPSDCANAEPRLRMSLYSPLDIHLYDEAGNHTGPKTVEIEGQEKIVFEENIPNSYYYQMGERKYVGFPAGQKIRVEMDGYALGSYTLKLEEVQATAGGEEILAQTTFTDLPVTKNTKVGFAFAEEGLNSMTPLEADVDGDGANDYVVEKNLNGVAELPLTAEMISQKVDLYAQIGAVTDSKTQEFLQVKLKELIGVEEMIAKFDGKENENPKNNQIKLFDKKIDDLTSWVENKFQETVLSPAKETLLKNLESIKI